MTLRAIAGYDPKDPYTWDIPVPDYRRSLDGDIRGVRVGVVKELPYSHLVEPEIRDAVLRATQVMGDLGASVEEVSIPLTTHARAIFMGTRVEPSMGRRHLVRDRFQEIGHDNRISLLTGSLLPAQAYYKSLKLRSLLRQQVLEALENVDVLVHPTAGVAAQKVQQDPAIAGKEKADRLPWHLSVTFSLTSTCAINVCCGFTSQNLPIGLQIGGRPFHEGAVMRVAHAYEQNTPWHTLRPPL